MCCTGFEWLFAGNVVNGFYIGRCLKPYKKWWLLLRKLVYDQLISYAIQMPLHWDEFNTKFQMKLQAFTDENLSLKSYGFYPNDITYTLLLASLVLNTEGRDLNESLLFFLANSARHLVLSSVTQMASQTVVFRLAMIWSVQHLGHGSFGLWL